MNRLNKITEAFEGEKDVIIICSKDLENELLKELKDISTKSPFSHTANFTYKKGVDSGITSVMNKGIAIHFGSDLNKLKERIINSQ